MFRIRVLDHIARVGLERFPPDRYRVGREVDRPDAILLRSADLRSDPPPDTVQAVARAGVGVNNIPVARLSEAGVPVFNTPGANANAVKELVLAGLLMAARNVLPALRFVHGLDADGEALERAVEIGKRQFDGFELPGRVLGVVGLGAVGVRVANAARALGMEVIGYDPQLTLTRAWELSSEVRPAASLEELLGRADAVSLHVPLADATRNLVSAERLGRFRGPVVLLNFSRAEVVDEEAVREGLDSRRILAYVTDFPSPAFRGDNRAIQLPPPRRVHPRSPGELRDHGRRAAAGISRGRKRGGFGQLPRRRDATGCGGEARHRQPQRPQRAEPDLERARRGGTQHRRHAEQVARCDRLHPRGCRGADRAGSDRAGRCHPPASSRSG